MSVDEDNATLRALERELTDRLPWVESAQVRRTDAGLAARLVASTNLLEGMGCLPHSRMACSGAIIAVATSVGLQLRIAGTGEAVEPGALANWRDAAGERVVDVIAQTLSLSNYLIHRADLESDAGGRAWSC